jgi:hypothetical protein
MSLPFFSVVIPTKNRSFLVGDAVRSVLRQTFPEFEVVVCDNDDTDATTRILGEIKDARLRHIRTGGLTMPDNWERAVRAARGEYICVLEDKQVFKRRALERIHREIQQSGARSVRWITDIYNDLGAVPSIKQLPEAGPARIIAVEEILRAFTEGSMWDAARMMPVGHFSAVQRRLAEEICRGPLGRLCAPISPDFTMAFQQLACGDAVLFIEAGLVVTSVQHSTGRSFMMKTGLGRQFTRELGGRDSIYYTHVPIKVPMVEGSIYNDYLAVQQVWGGKLAQFPLNWTAYFVECYRSILKTKKEGVSMAVEEQAWKSALAQQPAPVQRAVCEELNRDKPLWVQNAQARLKWLRRETGLLRVEHAVRNLSRRLRGSAKGELRKPFHSPLEYLEWTETQTPAAPAHPSAADAANGSRPDPG